MKWQLFFENFLKSPDFRTAQGPIAPDFLAPVLFRILTKYQSQKLAVLFPTAQAAENAGSALQELLTMEQSQTQLLYLPETGRGKLLFPGEESRRSRALDQALNLQYDIIYGSVHAFTGAAPEPDESRKGRIELRPGMNISPEQLIEKLIQLDYDDEYETTVPGEFSRRGGIIDLYSPAHNYPCRVEYFGDEIDTLRKFAPETQRSIGKIESYQIIGRAGITAGGAASSCAITYLPQENLVVAAVDPHESSALLIRYAENTELKNLETLLGKCNQKNCEYDLYTGSGDTLPPELPDPGILPVFESKEKTRKKQKEDHPFHLTALREMIRRQEGTGGVTLITADTPEKVAVLKKWCNAHDLPKSGVEYDATVFRSGFLLPAHNLLVVTEKELMECGFSREVIKTPVRTAAVPVKETMEIKTPEFSLAEIDEGDLAVHLDHGIGIFRGFKILTGNNISREVIAMEYRDGQILYVPLLAANKLSRYLGAVGQVKLHAINSGRWKKECVRAGAGVRSYAADMLRLQAMRQSIKGIPMPPDTKAEELFLNDFPFQDTPDQRRGTVEIGNDLAGTKPMDRLLCGDVGYGKTELAMRAAFRAVSSGFQVAVIAPTTVLVQQHLDSFRARFAKYPFVIEELSRFNSAGDQEQTIQRLASGGVDIVIGTHRLCSSRIRFRNLGLVIIDEEQRFGVAIKEHLRRYRAEADVLSMSATPIPRTLYLAMAGARDLTTLMTPPKLRLPVKTVIAPEEPELIADAIKSELARGGQVYYLHNRVKTIPETVQKLKKIVPECRLAFAHGQMPESELEEVMRNFVNGQIDCLVSSTIIESGLDVPNANTILIERADRFGLGQLYQLRGRVGRWKHQAYAYLLLPKNTMISTDARKRLAAIRRCSTLGAGFQLALHDLEIRGAGNILGAEQSGHLNTIGFDLYCHLLKQEVASLSGRKLNLLPEVELTIEFVSYTLDKETGKLCCCFPRAYISCDRLRFDAYRRLGNLNSEEELEDFRAELRDRYGKLPEKAENLLQVIRCRILAALAGYRQLSVVEGRVSLNNPGGVIYRLHNGCAPRLDSRDAPELRIVQLIRILRAAGEEKEKGAETHGIY